MKTYKQFLLENPPAWHGTPHEVDEFKLHKIGTGEGNQAYGWGLYFSSSRKVAQWYRDKLANNNPTLLNYKGVSYGYLGDAKKELVDVLKKDGYDVDMIYSALMLIQDAQSVLVAQENYEWAKGDMGNSGKVYKLLKKFDPTPVKGNLYQVDIIPDDEEFLDYDKPLDEQSEFIKSKIFYDVVDEFIFRKQFGMEREEYTSWEKVLHIRTGHSLYTLISMELGSPEKASKYLLSLGIPGLMYKGVTSKAFNYVVFDDTLIKIKEKHI